MSSESLAIIGAMIGSVLLLIGTLRSNRSTDQATVLEAAQAMREEASAAMSSAWEAKLSERESRIEHLQTDLTKALEQLREATVKIDLLTREVASLQAQVTALGGAPDER